MHRTTTQRTYQPTAPDSRSDAVLMDQPAEQVLATDIRNTCSGRSAVETVVRLDDPEQQKKLIQIVLDDVHRLDRLISDISDASRLDAELSRAEGQPVDLVEHRGRLGPPRRPLQLGEGRAERTSAR